MKSRLFLHKIPSILLAMAVCVAITSCKMPSTMGDVISAPPKPEPEKSSGVNINELLSKTFSPINLGGSKEVEEGSASRLTAVSEFTQPTGPQSAEYSSNFSQPGAGLNIHIWRSALEVLSFMPMALADPMTGLIQTDWHQSPGNNVERIRVEVYVLSDYLREDALRVNVYRQTMDRQTGQWFNATINPSTARQLENRILERANERKASFVQ